MSHPLNLVLGALAAAAAGVPAWRHFAPRSFWLLAAFPVKAIRVHLTWAHVTASCGLAARRRRWRWTLDAVPVAGSIARTSVLLTERRRVRRVDVPHPPGLGLLRPSTLGWSVRIRLREGQVPADYIKAAEQLAHAWRVHAVRVTATSPGRVRLLATRTDPLTTVSIAPEAGELLTVRPGMLETGQPWVIDFRVVPHWLNAGATQSGKSNLANAIIKGLAPQPVALAGFDLKGGVEFTPYSPRLSALATTRAESCALLDDLVRMLADRMRTCRDHGARNIWRLPEALRPVPVVVLVDEVAELFLMADKSEKDQVTRTATGLLRVAQLGRAFGVYLIICGQRIGADLGPGVTALRAQLTGRICHRVNDPETANMTLGDLDPAALDAARLIPADTPGVAIVAGQDGTWHRARSVLVTEDDAERAARAYAHLTPDWATLTRTGPVPAVLPDHGQDEAA
jgi:FtsK/SpoIIIE family